MAVHFVLDQNFPWHVTTLRWPSSIQVSRLGTIEPTLTAGHEDWEVLLALNRRGDVDGFITNDSDMLLLPTEMVALSKTGLTLVIVDGVGHDSVRATGLVMAYLLPIAQSHHGAPRIVVLKPGPLRFEHPKTYVTRHADRLRQPVGNIINAELRKMGLTP